MHIAETRANQQTFSTSRDSRKHLIVACAIMCWVLDSWFLASAACVQLQSISCSRFMAHRTLSMQTCTTQVTAKPCMAISNGHPSVHRSAATQSGPLSGKHIMRSIGGVSPVCAFCQQLYWLLSSSCQEGSSTPCSLRGSVGLKCRSQPQPVCSHGTTQAGALVIQLAIRRRRGAECQFTACHRPCWLLGGPPALEAPEHQPQ